MAKKEIQAYIRHQQYLGGWIAGANKKKNEPYAPDAWLSGFQDGVEARKLAEMSAKTFYLSDNVDDEELYPDLPVV